MTGRREYTPADFAAEVLARYDRGEFGSPFEMMGHMATALRQLLGHGQGNHPAVPGVPPPCTSGETR